MGFSLLRLCPAVAVVAAAAGCVSPSEGTRVADLLISGGEVFDGRSETGRIADIAIAGDRILFIGDARGEGIKARQTVDAGGLMVMPGLIDPHTHSGDDVASSDPERRAVLNHLMQGVTTIFIGNDGGGSPDVAGTLEDSDGAGVNVATFVGFGPVRRQVVGEDDRAPMAAEVDAMRALVAKGMCEGALGFSAGLYYAPQSFSEPEEVVALAREAGLRGGVYETHLRDEGSAAFGLLPALDEALDVGRKAGLPVHVAHIKALGVTVHGSAPEMIRRIEAARTEGVRVTADQYPWNASGTRLTSALLPRWSLDGGRSALRQRLADPTLQARLSAGIADNLAKRGGAGAILITGGEQRGKRLDAIAEGWAVPPIDAVLRILREEGDAPIASFNMADADMNAFARMPWVVGSSDATDGHPRKFGSFAGRWQRFVRNEPHLTPGEFVRRSSGLTAEIFGLEKRGTLTEGHFADIAIIDPRAYAAQADYAEPERLARGVHSVIVNGALVISEGRPTGRLAGRALAKPRQSSWSCPS